MNDGHCVFVMKQNFRLVDKVKRSLERVYDCMNSWGFKEPFITISTKHPAIMAIYKVTPIVKRMHYQPNVGGRSSGAQGGSGEDYLFG